MSKFALACLENYPQGCSAKRQHCASIGWVVTFAGPFSEEINFMVLQLAVSALW